VGAGADWLVQSRFAGGAQALSGAPRGAPASRGSPDGGSTTPCCPETHLAPKVLWQPALPSAYVEAP